MVVQDNERAQQMANSYFSSDPEYLTDERWWQLVEEQDAKILGDVPGGGGTTIPDGFLDGASDTGATPAAGDASTASIPTPTSAPAPAPLPPRRPLFELTRKYVHPTFRVEYEIAAFAVDPNDPELPTGQPWIIRLDDVATRTYAFLVDVSHDVFRSTTMMPLDGLLVDLTHRTIEFLRGQSQDATVAAVLSDFREQYCADTRLDEQEIIANAGNILGDLCRAAATLVGDKALEIYAELSDEEKGVVARRMATRGAADPKTLIQDGRYWEYADGATVRKLFLRHPELFLDGRYWGDAYETVDFGDSKVSEEARAATVARYDAYLGDAVWLADQMPADLERTDRDIVVRGICSLRLLRPDVAE
jgi:hypothetical protein